MNHNPDDHLDFRSPTPPPPSTPPPPQPHHHPPNVVVSNPIPLTFASSSSTSLTIADTSNAPQRKKRSKLTRPDDDDPAQKRPKPSKKPDPSAPKITTPCTECGRTFWSWKALFGHMRCHPERHWRGIQPPPDFLRAGSSSSIPVHHHHHPEFMSEDDHDAASSLLILAGGTDQTQTETQTQLLPGTSDCRENDCRFECSSCKKVFGSHQALGGHRASHKNVKGCFAITKSDVDVDEEHHHPHHLGNVVVPAGSSYGVEESMEESSSRMVESGHQCGICWRVFSSGQALGGHKRCHWEKGEEGSVVMTQLGMSSNVNSGGGLDLNLPASASASASVAAPAAAAADASAPASEDDQCSSFSSPGLGLDLRLGL